MSSAARRSALVIFLAVGMAAAAAAETPRGTSCDLDLVRVRAEESYPDYRVEVGRGADGVVTLRLAARHGDGVFAVALHAVGTQLATSMAARRMADAELRRVAEPVATWWQRADLQRTLAACTVGALDVAEAELRAAARNALAADTQERQPPSLTLLASWIAYKRLTLLFGLAWIALATLLFLQLRHRARSPAERAALLALFGCSLALSWLLCVGGPGDLRLNLAAIWWGDELELRWGPAPVGLFRLLDLVLGGINDSHIASVNLVVSSLVPVVIYAITAELGVGTVGSLIAAFIVAAHPFFIAFSADLGRQPTLMFAMFASVLGLIGFLKRGAKSAFGAFVLGTILAITSRPEGVHVLVLNAAMLLFVPSTARRRGTAGVVVALIAGLAFVYVLHFLEYGRGWANETHAFRTNATAPPWTIVLSRDFTPAAWILAWTAGLALGIRRRAAWIALFILVALHVAWSATGVYDSFVGYDRQVASARYQSVLLLPFGIGIALFVESMRAFGTRTAAIGTALLAVFTVTTYGRAYDTLLTPFTVDYEYRFLRRHVLTLPREARVYVLEPPANDVGFVDASLVHLFVHRDVTFEVWDLRRGKPLPSGVETYLYIGSSCAPLVDQDHRPLGEHFPQWLRDCAAIRTRLAGDAVEEIDVPAHKMSWYAFTQPTVRLGLYRLPPRPSGAD